MNMHYRSKSAGFSAVVLAAAMVLSGVKAPAQDAPASPITAWPLRVDGPSGLLTVYEPQPEKFEGDTLTARAAVSLTPPGSTDPEFGALWLQARVVTDRDARTVVIQNITIRQIKLPNSTPEQEQKFGQVLQQQVPGLNVTLSLDQLEATLGVVQKAKEESKQLQNAPPKIIFAAVPTTLVVLDGPPKLQAADVTGVMRVVNTPFILLLDLESKHYFLKAGDTWQTAADLNGPWVPTGSVPASVVEQGNKLSDQNAGANAQPPGQPARVAPGPTQIIVSQEPAELITSDGTPSYTPLPGNDLLYMSNTTADVFMEVASQQFFVLLSGRWYQGRGLNGPWTFVDSDKLPSTFASIPPESSKGNVLVSVAGTQPAKDARLDAYIPQTSAIRRDSGSNLNVTYDGEPQFVPVENTPITYASNCADPVLYVENSYYCCHQAVWYRSGVAVGPWVVATAVPQVIYTLPPSCPVYNCRYVYVYDSTPDLVYCGYLPGYTGCYVYGPTVVYGTGYNYPYWYRSQFIARPYTWGFGARYDYYSGSWGLGASVYYGRSWFADDHDRRNWWGPQGYVDYREVRERHDRRDNVVYNVHDEHITKNVTNVRNVTINRVNIYNREENVKRNVFVDNSNHNRTTNIRQGEQGRPDRAGRAEAGQQDRGGQNNIYAGHDGQVYRRTDQGWEANHGKTWSQVKGTPEAEARQGEAARSEGNRASTNRPDVNHPDASHTEANPMQANRVQPDRTEPNRQRLSDRPDREAGRGQARDNPVIENRKGDGVKETPDAPVQVRRTPPQRTPAHETPAQQTPTNGDTGFHARQPVHQPPDPSGGLEEDHVARERSVQHFGGSGGGGSNHIESGGGGNGGGAGQQRGGGGGGGESGGGAAQRSGGGGGNAGGGGGGAAQRSGGGAGGSTGGGGGVAGGGSGNAGGGGGNGGGNRGGGGNGGGNGSGGNVGGGKNSK